MCRQSYVHAFVWLLTDRWLEAWGEHTHFQWPLARASARLMQASSSLLVLLLAILDLGSQMVAPVEQILGCQLRNPNLDQQMLSTQVGFHTQQCKEWGRDDEHVQARDSASGWLGVAALVEEHCCHLIAAVEEERGHSQLPIWGPAWLTMPALLRCLLWAVTYLKAQGQSFHRIYLYCYSKQHFRSPLWETQ